MDFNALNQVCIAAFGEPAAFTTSGGVVTLQAVFAVEQPDDAIGGASFNSVYQTLTLLKTAVDVNGIALRSAVTVRGHNYHIINISDDPAGMVTLKLRRYQ